MSVCIPLEHFAHTARHAARVGGFLDITPDNELVVRGSTWVGRRVEWLRQHLFPGKLRQKNQKILDALKKTLFFESDFWGEESVPRDTLSARGFAREVEKIVSSHYEKQLLERKKTVARRQGREYFGAGGRFFATQARGFSRAEAALLGHMSNGMSGLDKEAIRTRYLNLLESVVADKKFIFLQGKIPKGSGERYQDSEGNLSARFLRAAYMVAAEESYREEKGEEVVNDNHYYGLGSQRELEWVRLKLERLG